jgi:serine/threonine-protein kinase
MIAKSGLLLEDGHYKLISRIAVGGMGEVWRAHDMLTNSPVAVKVLRPEYTGDAVSLKRLRFEARNAAMLNHPNITQVLDYGEVGGTGYIVMEYVDGQSMADVLATHSTIAPLRLLPILIQSSLGLHAAHSAGVVHRDVKPGNILLGHADHVKLTDFGISVAHGQQPLTDTGKVMGTAQYLAPEQALGNPATPAGDLYSLGVIAYEALAGERPFRGSNYVAIALAQVNEQPPPLPTSVEKSLAALVMRLMEKDAAKRPADGAELAALFGEILEIHRELASRLLATRRGTSAPEPLRAEAAGPAHTAEQPVVSVMPEEAPLTAAAPQVSSAAADSSAASSPHVAAPEDGRPTEPALPASGERPPVFPPPAPERPAPPPKRRVAPGQTPEIAIPLATAPPVPSKEELFGPVPSQAVPAAPVAPAAGGADGADRADGGAAAAPKQSPKKTETSPVPSLDKPRRRDEFPAPGGPATPAGGSAPADDARAVPRSSSGDGAPGDATEARADGPGTGEETPGAKSGEAADTNVSPPHGWRPTARPEPVRRDTGRGQTKPKTRTSPNPRRRVRTGAGPRPFSRDWWAPLLVAAGLIVILLIGLLTAVRANQGAGNLGEKESLFPFGPQATIMIASNAPETAHLRER